MHIATARELLWREHVAAACFRTVRGDDIGLRSRVGAHDHAIRSTPRRVAPDDDGSARERCPFALDAKKLCVRFEDEVVPSTLDEGSVDADAKLHRFMSTRGLCDRALLISREHAQKSIVGLSDNIMRGATLSKCIDGPDPEGFAVCLAASLARSAHSSAATTGASRGMTRRVASAFASRVGRLLRPSRAGLRSSSRATTRTIRPRRSRLRARPTGRRSRALRAGRSSACRA